MKRIFITSFHPFISRNILRTEILTSLSSMYRVSILVPNAKVDFFKREFQNDTVEIIPIEGKPKGYFSFFFKRLARAMFGVRMDFITAFRTSESSRLKRFIKEALFFYPAEFLGKFKVMRSLLRFSDFYFARDERFKKLLLDLKPDLVFSTDIQNENDVALLKEASRLHIKMVGMVRSWDNLTIHGLLRFLPSTLLVSSEILKSQAVSYNDIKASRVAVVGVPHYDIYKKGPTKSRDDFFCSINANPSKPLLFYAPFGDMYIRDNDVDQFVLESLTELDASIIVRLPPTDIVSLGDFKSPPNMFFYRPGINVGSNPLAPPDVGRQEISKADDDHLINSLYYADVVICGPSTIIIDSAFFNKPIVAVGFDGPKKRTYKDGVKQYYDYEYIRPVMECGGLQFALDRQQMQNAIVAYLQNSKKDEDGRSKIIELECYKSDGNSSRRVVESLTSMLK